MKQATLYGIAHLGAEGYAVFWRGAYDDTRYPTREAAIRKLAELDRGEQPQARPEQCRCDARDFPHRRDHNCADRESEARELRDVSRIGDEAAAINADARRADYWTWRP